MAQAATQTLTPIEFTPIQTRLTADEEQAVLRVLREGETWATGAEGQAFEAEFTQFLGSTDSVGVCSGTAALELAALLSGIGAGDEVIIPAHTFVSSAVPFGKTGATIRWADIDPDTQVVSADSIASLVTGKTKVVVVTHLYGLPADMDAIMGLAKQHGFQVVEDCAQAPGARYKGKRVGTFGDYGCFSFHTQKNISTLGEGGMLTLASPETARTARRLRWMGNWPFESERDRYWLPAMGDIIDAMPGRWPVNFCLGEPNAAVGRLLIKRLDAINAQRREQAARFKGHLADFPELRFQHVPDGCEHAYHLLQARYDGPSGRTRDDLIAYLYEQQKVKCIIQYWPLHRTELFRAKGFGEANVPESDRFFDNMISFPWWSQMGDDLIDDMAQRVRKGLEKIRG